MNKSGHLPFSVSTTYTCTRRTRRDHVHAFVRLLCSFVVVLNNSIFCSTLLLSRFPVVVECWSQPPPLSSSPLTFRASSPSSSSSTRLFLSKLKETASGSSSASLIHRREAFVNVATVTAKAVGIAVAAGATATTTTLPFLPSSSYMAFAYTPDPDKLQESLYFISRVQEATVQQERFINKAANGGNGNNSKELQSKLKLTLRLVDKNYKLLDQINYSSAYITPSDKLVEASEAGYESVDALQNAIDYVRNDENWAPQTQQAQEERTLFLTTSMQACREQLFIFLNYMPPDKLQAARFRVEDENVKNRDEFDGDDDAGVYNPVVLPWKITTPSKTAITYDDR